MSHISTHPWNLTPKEAIKLQKSLRSRIRFEKLRKEPKLIAGCDISYNKRSPTIYAGIVVLRYPELTIIEEATAITGTSFPYIPGLLSFRESPAVLEAWKTLHTTPDLLIVDGQGYAHPRRFGIAGHLGLLLDVPTIGCAKSVLTGRYEEPNKEKGSTSPLIDKEETIGMAVRTRRNVRPVFVSAGHRITVGEAVNIILQSTTKYRLPEPTRRAHMLVNSIRLK